MTELQQTFDLTTQGVAEIRERVASRAVPAGPGVEPPVLGSEHDPFSRALRVGGALMLAVSASTFMFQSWSSQGDVGRYFMLLGHTLAIAFAALLCSTGLRAARSARTLFGLVLASAPVHFTVLGALVYSRVGAVTADLPASALWAAPSLAAALMTAGGALALLLPAGGLALRVLSRNHAGKLGATLALSSSLLLIPVREPTLIGFGLMAATLVLLFVDGLFETQHELRTLEGRAVRLLCFVPIAIIAGRGFIYYEVTSSFVASAVLCGGWVWSSMCARGGFSRGAVVLQRFAVVPVTLAALVFANAWSAHFSGAAKHELSCIAFVSLLWAVLVPMSERALGGSAFYRVFAAYATCAVVLLDVVVHGTTLAALVAILGGAAMMVSAALLQRYALMAFATLCTLAAVSRELYLVVDVSALRHWGSLAVAGLVLMLGAAVLEKHGRRLGQRALAVREHMSTWDW